MRTVVPQSRHRLLVLVASLFLAPGCFLFGLDFGNGSGLIDPSNPDALTSALSIPGAELFEGLPPGPGGYGPLPSISGSSRLEAKSGSRLLLNLNVSASGPLQFFLKVKGARDHFRFSEYLGSPGSIGIPIDLSEAIGSGAFGFETSVQDESGNVSYPASTVVDVSRPGGGQTPAAHCNDTAAQYCKGGTLRFCTDYGGQQCWYELDGTPYRCDGCSCDSAAKAVAASCQ